MNRLREKLNEAVGFVILTTVSELRGALNDLRSLTEMELLKKKHAGRIKQVDLQISRHLEKLEEVRKDQSRQREKQTKAREK